MDVSKIFEEHKIIPDVLPVGTKISHNLGIHWPSVSLRAPGERLHRDELQDEPTITTNYKPGDASKEEFVLLMVDPDLTHYNDGTFGQVRHWLVTKVTVSHSGEVIVNHGSTISPYVGPAPMAAHLVIGEARPSRYTFFLLKHTSEVSLPTTFDPSTLRGEYEYGGDTSKLGNSPQNIIDRMGFNTQAFIQKNGLEVVAATFMFVEGNVKSTITSAALLASGAAQKAVGL
ncbi:mitochondrial 54S ribosomal protein mL38 [Colletotrichum truncatum]|uniref:PEBP-like protein n=1 Tax=Colletotrichum truncatum TaxID=5467 RepID=A0ACC3YYX3_COLTU|nr:PEBP-like protein [Colletotrichum truncatum]KAF6781759.1 PEBP-like protein [Colletotrichum truncatum]